MDSTDAFHVAIVGGGLGGISLAIALKVRNISFTIYEARGAFTEIGAGINFAPNGLEALRLIAPPLGEKIYAISTRNLPPHEDTYMFLRYGAPLGEHKDGEVIVELKCPPTGNTTMHRQELLSTLANHMGEEHAKFNKKLDSYEQCDSYVKLKFADGTEETASILVGSDGIHSRVRATMFGDDNIVSKPHFNHDGAYRAVIPMEKVVEAIGETARQSQAMLGPNGYLICYPVSGGTAVNAGAWQRKTEAWERSEWILPNQNEQFQFDLKDWGERAHKILALFDSSPTFWAAHQHICQPESFMDGRVILIGDSAHSMPPHQGAGASQAVEDAFVLAETLTMINDHGHSSKSIQAVLKAVQQVRQPRFSKVQEFSTYTGPLWYSFYENKLEGSELEEWIRGVEERLNLIWHGDIAGDAQRARGLVQKSLSQSR